MSKRISITIKDSPAAERMWDYVRNTLNPAITSVNSHQYAHFICPECNNSWYGIIRDSINHGLCPECNRKKNIYNHREKPVSAGNSLLDVFPELVNEWVDDINAEMHLYPESVSAYSNHKVAWKCPKCQNIYEATITNRTRMHSNCPYCSGQKVAPGYNDFASQRPDLLTEWDYEQNDSEGLFPNQLTCGSKKEAHWICPLGHRYKRAIKDRTSGKNCSVCGKASQTSFPEQAIYFYVKQHFESAKNRFKFDNKYEIDIFIPECKIGIEYDGFYHRSEKRQEKDRRKSAYLAEASIRLIRIIEDETAPFSVENDIIITPIDPTYKYMNRVIEVLLEKVGVGNQTITINKNIQNIYSQYISLQKENSVSQNASLLAEWDYDYNGKITPEAVSLNSNQKVSWICPKGHSYLASPKHRNNGTGCPYCAGKMVLSGYNDFESYSQLHPDILADWDYANNPSNLSEIYYSSTSVFNWVCSKCKRQYQKKLSNVVKGERCPYCSHKLVSRDISFGVLHPEALLDWDREKNALDPYTLAEYSNKQVFWKCHVCGNETKATVGSRAKGFRCTKCAVSTIREKSTQTRVNNRGSLAIKKPLLLQDWDYQKNTDISPEIVTEGSGRKVWWICSLCKNQWEDTINSRSHGKKCPSCGFSPYPKPKKEISEESKRDHQRKVQEHAAITIVQRRGSLKENKPLLAAEWNSVRNSGLPFDASEVTAGSKKIVWWKCSNCQNEWEDMIQLRSDGKKCPACGYTPYPRVRKK